MRSVILCFWASSPLEYVSRTIACLTRRYSKRLRGTYSVPIYIKIFIIFENTRPLTKGFCSECTKFFISVVCAWFYIPRRQSQRRTSFWSPIEPSLSGAWNTFARIAVPLTTRLLHTAWICFSFRLLSLERNIPWDSLRKNDETHVAYPTSLFYLFLLENFTLTISTYLCTIQRASEKFWRETNCKNITSMRKKTSFKTRPNFPKDSKKLPHGSSSGHIKHAQFAQSAIRPPHSASTPI